MGIILLVWKEFHISFFCCPNYLIYQFVAVMRDSANPNALVEVVHLNIWFHTIFIWRQIRKHLIQLFCQLTIIWRRWESVIHKQFLSTPCQRTYPIIPTWFLNSIGKPVDNLLFQKILCGGKNIFRKVVILGIRYRRREKIKSIFFSTSLHEKMA